MEQQPTPQDGIESSNSEITPGLEIQTRKELYALHEVLSYQYMHFLDGKFHEGPIEEIATEFNRKFGEDTKPATEDELWTSLRSSYYSKLESVAFDFINQLEGPSGPSMEAFRAYGRLKQMEAEGWKTAPDNPVHAKFDIVFPLLNNATDMALEIIEATPHLVENNFPDLSEDEKVTLTKQILQNNPRALKMLATVHEGKFDRVKEIFGHKLDPAKLELSPRKGGYEVDWNKDIRLEMVHDLRAVDDEWAKAGGIEKAIACPALHPGPTGESGIDIMWRVMTEVIQNSGAIEKTFAAMERERTGTK